MGFNSAFKGLKQIWFQTRVQICKAIAPWLNTRRKQNILVTNKRRGNGFTVDKVVFVLENYATKEYSGLQDNFPRIRNFL